MKKKHNAAMVECRNYEDWLGGCVQREKNNQLDTLIRGVIGSGYGITIDLSISKGGRYFATIRRRDSERIGLGMGAILLEAITTAIEDSSL